MHIQWDNKQLNSDRVRKLSVKLVLHCIGGRYKPSVFKLPIRHRFFFRYNVRQPNNVDPLDRSIQPRIQPNSILNLHINWKSSKPHSTISSKSSMETVHLPMALWVTISCVFRTLLSKVMVQYFSLINSHLEY